MECETFGKKSFLLRVSDFLVKRKGYVCIGMSKGLEKELYFMGVQ